jgi:hypothetical protein
MYKFGCGFSGERRRNKQKINRMIDVLDYQLILQFIHG